VRGSKKWGGDATGKGRLEIFLHKSFLVIISKIPSNISEFGGSGREGKINRGFGEGKEKGRARGKKVLPSAAFVKRGAEKQTSPRNKQMTEVRSEIANVV